MISSHREKLLSGLGGGVSILLVFGLTRAVELSLHADILLIASMGASAVLLFAAPHSPLSQPWNVIGGHVISALIGVAANALVADTVTAAGLAAGVAIAAMYYLGCLHPPGGASAVIPVISGPATAHYGLMLPVFPIGAGAVFMVLFAIAYNLPFHWRRYPLAAFARPQAEPQAHPGDDYPYIAHADFVAALAEIDTYVDISEEDLLRIYDVAMQRSRDRQARSGR